MKSMIFAILTLSAIFSTNIAFASSPGKFECNNGGDTLSFYVNSHMGDGPTLYGLKLNDSKNDSGYAAFSNILSASKKCEDLSSYSRVTKGEVLICAGEMFASNGIYGQVILTMGGLEVFKEVLAPLSGWKCD